MQDYLDLLKKEQNKKEECLRLNTAFLNCCSASNYVALNKCMLEVQEVVYQAAEERARLKYHGNSEEDILHYIKLYY